MRIIYLSLSYVPSRRASAVHVMKMCSALGRLGHDVTLVTKLSESRQEPEVLDDFAFYGVPAEFSVVKLWRPAVSGGGLVFLNNVRQFLATNREVTDLVYARDLPSALIASQYALPIVFEAHAPPSGKLGRFLFRRLISSERLRRLIVISNALRNALARLTPLVRTLDIVVAHDASDPCPVACGTNALSNRFAPLKGGPNCGYVGNLYPGRGISQIIAVAENLPEHRFHLIGGSEDDISRWQAREIPDNVQFHGFVNPSHVAGYYREFDVLLAPYQRSVRAASGGDITAWMSPMKLFEYMAAGKPIIASDLPVIGEILTNEHNALLVDPERTGHWVDALNRLSNKPQLARDLAATALTDFQQNHTWHQRASRVIDGL